MAGNFPLKSGAILKSRPGHDKAWSCDKHDHPVLFFCETHQRALCHPYAFKEHRPCQINDIEDVIKKLRKELEGKMFEIGQANERMAAFDRKIKCCLEFADKHMESMKKASINACEKEIQSESEKEKKEAQKINREANEKLRLVNKDREAKLRKCHESAEQRKKSATVCQRVLLQDITDKESKIQEKICEFENERKTNNMKIQDSEDKIKKLLQSNEDLVSSGRHVIAALDETLKSIEDQGKVDKMKYAVQSVRCTTGKFDGELYGRIESYIGKWELVDTISIPENVTCPLITGLVGDDEIGITECTFPGDFYVTHIRNKHTEKVIESDMANVRSCTRVNRDTVIYGKDVKGCKGNSLNGCIILYNRETKLKTNITIPKNTTDDDTLVYVDVDRNGMILAAERAQSNIYVINPASGKTVDTITVKGNKVRGPMRALHLSPGGESGDIVVQTGDGALSVISRLGDEKISIHDDKLVYAGCSVDQLTDTLYITNWDYERGVYTVDQASRDGVIRARRIVEYADSNRGPYFKPSFVTPSGKLVSLYSNEVFIYKKSFL